jgi:hypothetical protein
VVLCPFADPELTLEFAAMKGQKLFKNIFLKKEDVLF